MQSEIRPCRVKDGKSTFADESYHKHHAVAGNMYAMSSTTVRSRNTIASTFFRYAHRGSAECSTYSS
jgi:hypothetical protein